MTVFYLLAVGIHLSRKLSLHVEERHNSSVLSLFDDPNICARSGNNKDKVTNHFNKLTHIYTHAYRSHNPEIPETGAHKLWCYIASNQTTWSTYAITIYYLIRVSIFPPATRLYNVCWYYPSILAVHMYECHINKIILLLLFLSFSWISFIVIVRIIAPSELIFFVCKPTLNKTFYILYLISYI